MTQWLTQLPFVLQLQDQPFDFDFGLGAEVNQYAAEAVPASSGPASACDAKHISAIEAVCNNMQEGTGRQLVTRLAGVLPFKSVLPTQPAQADRQTLPRSAKAGVSAAASLKDWEDTMMSEEERREHEGSGVRKVTLTVTLFFISLHKKLICISYKCVVFYCTPFILHV